MGCIVMSRTQIPRHGWGVCILLAYVGMAHGQDTGHVASEDDYFANVPVVLTASRLDQPLNEAPGSITVIDRNTIRLSGARTVAEVLRLVPGYLSGGWNGANPVAAYHIPLDDYGTRNLVLIDGRSVYASSYLGDTHRGMMDVLLDDIERIEVLRGSNAAAYGANAMFGVINIITRHSADTVGSEVSVTQGDNGIADRMVRFGVGNEKASFRLSAGEQRDTGYLNAYDDMKLSQLHGRADFKPNLQDDLMLKAGVSYLSAGEGFPGADGNPLHTIYTRDSYFNAQWKHEISNTDEVQVSANYMEDWKQDQIPYPPLPAVLLDFGAVGRRVNLEVQRKMSLGPDVRTVLGLGYKDERAQSQAVYSRPDWLSFQEERFFGTLEWRAAPKWLFNAGLFVGQQSLTGTYVSPRLMVNWLVTPEHTFRAGITDSTRPPSLFEYYGDIRYYLGGTLIGQTTAARGDAEPEKLHTEEIGYQGRFIQSRVTVDVRAFHERMDSIIGSDTYTRSSPLPGTGSDVTDYINKPGLDLTGIESQVRWKPAESSEIWLNQGFTHLQWDDPALNARSERQPPKYATTIAWFQKLPGEWQLSVIHQRLGSMTWRDDRDWLAASHRTDVRLAYPFRLGSNKAEASVTVQSIEGARPFFLPREGFEWGRRSFLNVRMEL
ncbi:MAG TPA: TonB-dependent receptor [Aquabacterium sp.]|nr:TonB-dependent receptor [Aquabacterium sp.]